MSASISRHCPAEIYSPLKSEGKTSPTLTRRTISLTRNVAELVSAHAAAAPKAIAITDDGRVMTYGELDERANRLANYLIELGVGPEAIVVEGMGTLRGKPEPDLFLASRERLGTQADDCVIVGDAIWDHIGARRAGMLSVGVLTGGYGEEELYHAGAFRVYRNIADLLQNLDELGILL